MKKSGHVSTTLVDAVVDEAFHIRSAKSVKATTRSALPAAAKDLLDGRLDCLHGEAEQPDAKADVAVVLLEGRSHLEGVAEGDDHVSGDDKWVGSRVEEDHEVGPCADARSV